MEKNQQSEIDFTKANFYGAGYDFEQDHERLSGQIKDIFLEIKDKRNYSLAMLEELTGHPQASISAALRTLRNEFGFIIDKKRSGLKKGTWFYRLSGKLSPEEFQKKKISNIKPIGNKHLFGEYMRSIYAFAKDSNQENSSKLIEAEKSWRNNFISEIRNR